MSAREWREARHRRPGAPALLVGLLVTTALTLGGCSRLLFGGAIPHAELNPPSGDYAVAIDVETVRSYDIADYYLSFDPDAPISRFVRTAQWFRVETSVSFRYFAVGRSGVRSEILSAHYRIIPEGAAE